MRKSSVVAGSGLPPWERERQPCGPPKQLEFFPEQGSQVPIRNPEDDNQGEAPRGAGVGTQWHRRLWTCGWREALGTGEYQYSRNVGRFQDSFSSPSGAVRDLSRLSFRVRFPVFWMPAVCLPAHRLPLRYVSVRPSVRAHRGFCVAPVRRAGAGVFSCHGKGELEELFVRLTFLVY